MVVFKPVKASRKDTLAARLPALERAVGDAGGADAVRGVRILLGLHRHLGAADGARILGAAQGGLSRVGAWDLIRLSRTALLSGGRGAVLAHDGFRSLAPAAA